MRSHYIFGNSLFQFRNRLRQVTFAMLLIASVSTTLKAQLSYDFGSGSDTIDFGQVKLGDSAIVDFTVSLDANSVDDYYVFSFHSMFYNYVLPDSALEKSNTLFDPESYRNASGCGISYQTRLFDFRDVNGSPLPYGYRDTIAPGESIVLKVIFKPAPFEFYEYLGQRSFCAYYHPEFGYCEATEYESVCSETSTSSEGIGDYEFAMNFQPYTDNLGPVYKTFTVKGEAIQGDPNGLFSSNTPERLAIYPNPATSIINTEEGQLEIMDLTGSPVLSTQSNGKVDVSNLETGIYFVTQNGKRTKLIIE